MHVSANPVTFVDTNNTWPKVFSRIWTVHPTVQDINCPLPTLENPVLAQKSDTKTFFTN